jgi:putative endonuclease
MSGYFYILASKRIGTLYCGVTNDLIRRVAEHKNGTVKGFTSEHNVKTLVYYEAAEDISDAIQREKCVKEWKREWKLELIEKFNPDWKDLYDDILQQ